MRPRKSLEITTPLHTRHGEPDLDELNDLLASGWRVTRTEAFHPADGGGRTSMLVVVEQEAPK